MQQNQQNVPSAIDEQQAVDNTENVTECNEKTYTYAKIDNKTQPDKQEKQEKTVRILAKCAVLAALGVLLLFVEFPLLPAVPWLKLNISDLPSLLASFMFGPLWGVAVNAVKVAISMAWSSTGFVGELSNFISGSLYCLVAGLIYLKHKTKVGAVISLACSSVVFCAAMWLCNQFLLLPFFGMTDNAVVVPALWWTLLFNVIKTAITSVVTFVVYKSTHKLFARF